MPLGLKPGENLVNNRSIDPESYQKYLQAKALVRTRGLQPKQLSDAVTFLEQVVAANPGFAPASSQLGLAYATRSNRYGLNVSGQELRRLVETDLLRAEQAARRAIQLDANHADGYVVLGRATRDQNRAATEDLYLKALTIDPNNPDALNYHATALSNAGRIREALPVRQRLQSLEPLVPIFTQWTATVLWLSGQDEAAIATIKDSRLRFFSLADIHATQGRYAEAADDLLKAPEGAAGQTVQDAARILRAAPARPASGATLPDLRELNWVYLYNGLPDRLFDYYEELSEAHALDPNVQYIWHPSFSAIRKTTRFKAFMRKVGLVDYWRAKGWPDACHPIAGDDFVCA